MSIVSYVKIENFRSIRSAEMSDLESYSPLVGLNSSGKSNVLRAINLFFNGHLDESRSPLDLATDFSSHAPRGKKKTVSVTVGLNLGSELKVRGQEEFHTSHGISTTIFIRRTWSLGADSQTLVDTVQFGPSLDRMSPATVDELPAVLTHVRAVRFVYVPNHARPADLIRSELAPLRSTLVARLRATKAYKTSQVNDLLAELGRMGDRMFGEVSTAIRRGIPGMGVTADLPADFADLVFTIGVQAIADGGEARPPEFEGSGAQSFMLLHVLDLADRTHRAGGFGWVQASIWAIEEPESFLHSGLRAQFSSDLRGYSEDPRRQVFVTTHQDEFVRVADSVWMAEKSPDTRLEKLVARNAIQESTRRSITTFTHPLFAHPSEPIVIVEGKFDDVYLRAALREGDFRPRWRLLSPSAAFGDQIGGDSVLEYLKYNRQVIASRPDNAPVIVLRDWEAKDKTKYDKALSAHPYSVCLVAPELLCNPELDESFAGIERFLSTALVKSIVPQRRLGREHSGGDARFSIKRRALEEFKRPLADAVEAGASAGENVVDLFRWLDDEVVKILDSVPASAFG